ncbi:MAG: aminotransferase class V-fold PLP-dependent enzyme, partial [Lachnospiraceae bacterium]|nr:aminotransferase class V-fold PLP-dependent enzyme [Lachnospiraceae bacterium]
MIYFDNAASTRMDDRVLEATLPYLKESFGNANGKYSLGYEARKAVNEARKTVASAVSAEPDEIYFTSGGTEGNNTALSSAKVIISSETEHDSVLKVIENAKKNGIKAVLLK